MPNEKFRINLRRAFVVNAGRTAGENDSVRVQFCNFGRGKIERNNFGVNLQLPHPASDHLGVLRAEIENKNL